MDITEIIESVNFTTIYWQAGMTLIFTLADIVTGFMQAVINKTVDSQKMREGIIRKLLLIVVMVLAFVAQWSFDIPAISKITCVYIILMEVISILENIKKAGIDLGKLGELLNIKQDNKNNEEDKKDE